MGKDDSIRAPRAATPGALARDRRVCFFGLTSGLPLYRAQLLQRLSVSEVEIPLAIRSREVNMTDVDHRVRWWRLVLLAVLVVGFFVVARVTGLNAYLSTERIRAVTAAAGFWGPIVFVLIFCLGELVHVPGAVFVAAAVVAYGRATGGVLAFVGALAAVSVSFVVVRTIGGKPLAAIRFSLARRILSHLEGHPVRTIFLLRLLLWMAPQLNYALALSSVRFRSYLFGTALGLLAPISGLVLLSDQLLR